MLNLPSLRYLFIQCFQVLDDGGDLVTGQPVAGPEFWQLAILLLITAAAKIASYVVLVLALVGFVILVLALVLAPAQEPALLVLDQAGLVARDN